MFKKTPIIPFILVTSLFALWGFANDITNPMVSAFKTVLEISNFKASLVQFAFYGGYFTMAIPAALFIRKYTYKKGILLGLALYATGALLFFPAANYESFTFFLLALYILTFGLAFLETTANPFILALGEEETATRRLNFAQSFNPIGSLMGMFVAQQVILKSLESDDINAAGDGVYALADEATRQVIRTHDLELIRNPYVMLGGFVLLMLILIAIVKVPNLKPNHEKPEPARLVFQRLIKNKNYVGSVLAQMFYVGAQIMCWTFIIQYAENLGYSKAEAQMYNIAAMVIFLISRILSTILLKKMEASKLLYLFAIGGIITISLTILLQNNIGLYCLVFTSFFMSLMFPTIYGIALKGLGEDAKLGSAGLVMAIVGGALMPPIQGAIMDTEGLLGLSAENISFVLPLICFVVIAFYAHRVYKSLAAN